eukprot:TCALIF_02097-PA protein Name:"Similar to nifk MKI67 FHA domain-interacting nucleolar phosphoprotein-like (Xenopus tropicalis)" AED:0.24 eAED:0.24 QI:0/-1/0/1/-1/1/1/0/369
MARNGHRQSDPTFPTHGTQRKGMGTKKMIQKSATLAAEQSVSKKSVPKQNVSKKSDPKENIPKVAAPPATVDETQVADPSIEVIQKESAPTKKKNGFSTDRGVVYIHSLPHGFYEKQLYKYMKQFGSVTRIKLVRSPKTGGSCGFAFVEFKYDEVARIVAETMNNYLMFDRLVKCEVLDPKKVKPIMFFNRVKPDKPPGLIARRKDKKVMNQLRTEEQNNRRLKKQLGKLDKVQKRLAELGVTSQMSFEKASKKLKGLSHTPIMAVDQEEHEVSMKTPPNVKKVRSRGNSAAATPNSGRNTPKGVLSNLPKDKKNLMLAKLTAKLEEGKPKATPSPGLKGNKKVVGALTATNVAKHGMTIKRNTPRTKK